MGLSDSGVGFVFRGGDIRQEVMSEAHSSQYSVHPGGTKMYRDIRQHFWWNGMKREIARFVSRCLVCQTGQG